MCPLRLSNNVRKNRLHLLGTNKKAIACVWRDNSHNCKLIPDFESFTEFCDVATDLCGHCFWTYCLPDDWSLLLDPNNINDNASQDDDSGMSSSDEADSE